MSLKESAWKWFVQGFNIVAVRFEVEKSGKVSKKPLVKWSNWVNRRQTFEEFESQPWDLADGFGIICSHPNDEGLFLAAVDYDTKKVSTEAKEKGKKVLEHFPPTKIEQTISGGLHYIYFSKVRPNPVSQYRVEYALELIAGPKLCIMAPSKGYIALNDNSPRVVEDIEGVFYQVLDKEDSRNGVNAGINTALLQRYLEKLKPHLKIAGEGPNYLYIHCPFHQPDKHPSFAIHKTKYYAVDFHNGRVYTLKELMEALNLTLPSEISVAFGRYILRVDGMNVFVYNDGKPIYVTSLKSITSSRIKKELAKYLGIESRRLEPAIAQLIVNVKVSKHSNFKDTVPKTKVETSEDNFWGKIIYADLD